MGFLLHIVVGILTIFLADKFVGGVVFKGPLFIFPTSPAELEKFFSTLFFVGGFLGFLNFFIKPILNLITLPLRLITFGLFSLVISLFLVWVVDLISPELIIAGLIPLFWTTLILWILTLLISTLFPKIKGPFSR